MMEALGTVETVGLVAAIEAADVACKTADVQLVGYELAKGGGFVTIKVLGKVGAVNAAVAAAEAAASRISRVVSTLVIPRPHEQIELLVHNADTRGWSAPEPPTPSPSIPEGDASPEVSAQPKPARSTSTTIRRKQS